MGGNQLVTESQSPLVVQAGLDIQRLLSQRRRRRIKSYINIVIGTGIHTDSKKTVFTVPIFFVGFVGILKKNQKYLDVLPSTEKPGKLTTTGKFDHFWDVFDQENLIICHCITMHDAKLKIYLKQYNSL